MIIVDTNFVSELMRPVLDNNFANWLIENKDKDLYITAITNFEIEKGIMALPNGKRKEELKQSFEIMENRFQNVEFDKYSSVFAAQFYTLRTKSGFKPSSEDMMLAGICAQKGAILATRNIKDFEGLPIDVVNPWAGRV